jgi:hypothetical protein
MDLESSSPYPQAPAILFNQQMHKVFVNYYLFLTNATCFDTLVSLPGSCLYAKITAN